jgi:outer membrane lipoprotein
MKRLTLLLCMVLWMSALIGCAPVISSNLRTEADPYLTFSLVQKAPSQFKGKIVIWSGSIIKTTNTPQGTLIEVLQHAADSRGKPVDTDHSEGRFMALDPKFLDPAIYAAGRLITVAGEIEGSRTQRMGEIDYLYPYLGVKELYLWPKEQDYYHYPYYDPYYYDRPLWWQMRFGTGWDD